MAFIPQLLHLLQKRVPPQSPIQNLPQAIQHQVQQRLTQHQLPQEACVVLRTSKRAQIILEIGVITIRKIASLVVDPLFPLHPVIVLLVGKVVGVILKAAVRLEHVFMLKAHTVNASKCISCINLI